MWSQINPHIGHLGESLRLEIHGLDFLAVTSEDEDDGQLRHFVIKREFAEGAIMMSMVKFPADALPAPGQPAPMMYRYSSSFISLHIGIRVIVIKYEVAEGAVIMSVIMFLAHVLPAPGQPTSFLYRSVFHSLGCKARHIKPAMKIP